MSSIDDTQRALLTRFFEEHLMLLALEERTAEAKKQAEAIALRATLEQRGGQWAATARTLGVTREGLYK